MSIDTKLSKLQFLLILTVFSLCLYGACTINSAFCPDETARQLVSNFIYNNNSLPTGNEQETIIPNWGFSYALRPYLSSIIAATFMKISSILYVSDYSLLVMSRMCSVLSVTGCCYVLIKTGNILFQRKISSTLFAVIVCFFPQVLFLGMYQNNDSLSLFAVALMVYTLVYGSTANWSLRSCLLLGLSFSLTVLSYYSVYGWVLCGAIFFFTELIRTFSSPTKNSYVPVLRKCLLVAMIILILTGWFFIRNAVLHDGDFLGLVTEKATREALISEGANLEQYKIPQQEGLTLFKFISLNNYNWLRVTTESTVGVFGYMNIFLTHTLYGKYYEFLRIAIISSLFAFLIRRNDSRAVRIMAFLLSSSAITFALSVYQSYTRDYQPQGRYIISVVILIGYIIAYASDNLHIAVDVTGKNEKTVSISPHWFLVFFWLSLFVQSWIESMSQMMK